VVLTDTATRRLSSSWARNDEIAEAADVGRMTVFNHFPRKKDMFFDLDDGVRKELSRRLRSAIP
jgi:AcrR family transcriptional regulator